jgi:hydrogenase expression/formation protein HypC
MLAQGEPPRGRSFAANLAHQGWKLTTEGQSAMCLGIPGRVLETYREHDVLMGKVAFGGVCKRVCLEHVAEAVVGDYVLVHVGFALTRLDEEEARRVFELLAEMNQLDELQAPDEIPR